MATIVKDSASIIAAAEKVLSHIDAVRNARDEKAISRVMQDKRGWPWARFYPTRDQAIKILDESNMLGWRSMYAWYDEDKAIKLRRLAKHGDPVTLDAEDVRVLFND